MTIISTTIPTVTTSASKFAMPSDIATMAILIKISISAYNNRKVDKQATSEVENNKGAKKGSATVSKKVLPDSYLTQLNYCHRELLHYRETMGLDMGDGWRMVALSNIEDRYNHALKLRDDYLSAANEVADKLHQAMLQAEYDLNLLYNPNDYLSKEEFLSKVGVEILTQTISQPAILKQANAGSVSSAVINQIMQQATMQQQDLFAKANMALLEKVKARVSEMSEKLKSYSGTKAGAFRDSLVDNIKELVADLALMNTFNDPTIESIRRQIEADLTKYDADDLRLDSHVRTETTKRADAIVASLAGLL